MTKFIDLNNLSSFKKFLLILKGKLTSYVFNNLSNKNISRFINLLFKPDGDLIYSNGYFIKKLKKKIFIIQIQGLHESLLIKKDFLNTYLIPIY